MRVAIVTSDLKGPIKCGGVGTAYSELAKTLVSQGHDVTILFLLIPGRPVKDFAQHQRTHQKNGIRLEVLKNPSVAIDGPEVVREAYAVYLNLKNTQFDLIHFPDMHGLGYFCMAAKRAGLDFMKTQIAVILNGPSHWHKAGNQQFLNSLIDLQYLFLERKSVEWADVLISPSQHAIDWARKEGWQLPERTQVIQYPYTAPLISARETTEVQEVIFFGRLETRKGLDIFIHALENMPPSELQGKKVVFLGKSGTVAPGESALEMIQRRSVLWSFEWEVKSDFGQEEAIRYLISKNAFAVIPSRDETLGYTVMECLGHQIPFLALDIPPFRELVHPEDVERVLVSEKEFAARLAEKLRTSQSAARFQVLPKKTLAKWRQLHDELELQAGFDQKTNAGQTPASLTVVILHQDRPEFLDQCIESLATQAFKFDICIVDNGSVRASSKAYLDFLESKFPQVQVLFTQQPLDPSAARNYTAENLNTDWILWLDDDNLLKPNAVQTLMAAAHNTGASLVTAALDCFESRNSPLQKPINIAYRTLFMGSDPALGFFRNVFGDTASLMKRDVFLDLGGFHFEPGCGNEDWEFFTRASLAGIEIVALPEALFWYRLSEEARSQTIDTYRSERFRRRPYENPKASWMIGLLEFSFGHLHSQSKNLGMEWSQRKQKQLAANIPVLGSVDDDLYQGRVRRQGKMVFEASPSTQFQNLKALWHCRLELLGSSVAVHAEGIDPAIEIEVPPFEKGARLRLDVEIEVTKASQMQAFYKICESDTYEEIRSVVTPLRPGFQEVSLWIPETCIGGMMRIDPVCEAMGSKIESLRIYALDEIENSSDRQDRLFEPHPISEDPEHFL